MIFNYDKYFYRRNMIYSMVASLAFIISTFVFFPKPKFRIPVKFNYSEPLITVIEIPRTNQLDNKYPPVPLQNQLTSLLSIVGEPIILDDIVFDEQIKLQNPSVDKSSGTQSKKSNTFESSAFTFVPRQLIEVVPQKVNGADGYIKIKLLIGTDGLVIKHNIIDNITTDKRCIENVIAAVYKSKWQPVDFEGEKVEYWIEKIFTFN